MHILKGIVCDEGSSLVRLFKQILVDDNVDFDAIPNDELDSN